MRKILIIVIIVLLLVLGISTVANGIQIGDFQILSISQIEEKNNEINNKIEEINQLNDTEYPSKIQALNSASNHMETAKSKYLNYTSLSTDEEILAAMQEKTYKIEFLWATLGTHARNEEVNLKFEILEKSIGTTKVNDIKFTVDGTYINIINFVYAIENDADLNFRIRNFKLLPYQSNGILEATFLVTNIAIEGNTSGQTITTDSTATNTANGTTTTTNTNTASTNTTNTNTANTNTTNTNTVNTNTVNTNTTNTNTSNVII